MVRTGPDLNVLAVVSLVLGILGFVALPGLGAAGAIVTGEVARRQIARSGQTGMACAHWGRILGALWFVLALTAILVFNPTLPHLAALGIALVVGAGLLLILTLGRRTAQR